MSTNIPSSIGEMPAAVDLSSVDIAASKAETKKKTARAQSAHERSPCLYSSWHRRQARVNRNACVEDPGFLNFQYTPKMSQCTRRSLRSGASSPGGGGIPGLGARP